MLQNSKDIDKHVFSTDILQKSTTFAPNFKSRNYEDN